MWRLKNGDLLAVFYAGYGHVSRPRAETPSGGAVALCRSSDGGLTWSKASIVLDTPLDDRDPSVWQVDDGTVFISCNAIDWNTYQPSSPESFRCYVYTIKSNDNGKTWTAPDAVHIGDVAEYTAWTEPHRLANGEWLWSIYRNRVTETTTAFTRSTDGGHTWGPPALIDADSKTTDEPDFCQFPDGSLFCAMRPGGQYMWQSWSRDNGHTWTKQAPLPFYGHSPCLLYTKSGVTLLSHRDPGMTISYSFDNAKTWAGSVMIDPCGGAMSRMVELPDGRVLIVYYSEGGNSEIRAQFLKVSKSGVVFGAGKPR